MTTAANRGMPPEEVVRALSALPSIRITTAADGIAIHVPAIEDRVLLSSAAVKRARRIFAPNGDPAVEFAVGDENEELPLIITPEDVVFAPAKSASLLVSSVPIVVADAPHLVAYSEMERDAERAALACAQSGPKNTDRLGATFLLLRCFVAGATRFGLRPLRTVAWWQQGWKIIGDDVALPPFRPDSSWDALSRAAEHITATPSSYGEQSEAATPARVTKADFEVLAPAMTAVQLDDEFLSSWESWIRITPATFAQALTSGLVGARADVSIYPDGAGTVDTRIQDGTVLHALLQLRFSFSDSTMAIDEIRIAEAARGSGLFQRLTFNAERLASLLGLKQITVHATGIGSYALAKEGVYPRDPELYRRTRPKAQVHPPTHDGLGRS
jgi:hypothetical protein